MARCIPLGLGLLLIGAPAALGATSPRWEVSDLAPEADETAHAWLIWDEPPPAAVYIELINRDGVSAWFPGDDGCHGERATEALLPASARYTEVCFSMSGATATLGARIGSEPLTSGEGRLVFSERVTAAQSPTDPMLISLVTGLVGVIVGSLTGSLTGFVDHRRALARVRTEQKGRLLDALRADSLASVDLLRRYVRDGAAAHRGRPPTDLVLPRSAWQALGADVELANVVPQRLSSRLRKRDDAVQAFNDSIVSGDWPPVADAEALLRSFSRDG